MKGLEECLTKFPHFNNIPSNLFKETMKITLKKTHLLRKNTYEPSKHSITKTLSKEIIGRSRLKNKLLNTNLILVEKLVTNSAPMLTIS